MSIYASAGFPVPVISYSILHQAAPGVPKEEYEQTMLEMHARVAAESASVAALEDRAVAELTARNAQMLRGTLAQFLETPIRSDNQELQKIFLESFDKYRDQLTERSPAGVIGSWEGALKEPGTSAGIRKMASAGKSYLRSLGFTTGKGAAPVYESVYLVNGARNLDVLEHIVRDRLGIYASTHGKHIAESGKFTVAAHNLILSAGAELPVPVRGTAGEGAIYFSKPDVPYDDFRASLAPLVTGLGGLAGVYSVSVWQRKLGLGRGEEFILRCILSDPGLLARIADVLKATAEPGVRDAVLGGGHLLLKELLSPPAP